MKVKRIATLGAIGGAIAVWYAAASTSSAPRPLPIGKPAASAVDVSGAALASEIARLHERLRPSEAPTEARDLFRYGARGARRSIAAEPAAQPAVAATVAPAAVVSPLKLVGIAEDAGDAAPVRTAILSGLGDLFLVKEGEAVTSRYRVASISAQGVELTDLADQSTLRLSLK